MAKELPPSSVTCSRLEPFGLPDLGLRAIVDARRRDLDALVEAHLKLRASERVREMKALVRPG